MPELLNLPPTGSPAGTVEGSLSVRPRERALIVARSDHCGNQRVADAQLTSNISQYLSCTPVQPMESAVGVGGLHDPIRHLA